MSLFPSLVCSAALSLTLAALLPQCRDQVAQAEPAWQDPQGHAGVAEQDKLVLLLSADMVGRLEPCGCASGQLGGLARRMQYIGERRYHDVLLEGGNLIAGSSPLDLEKLATAITVLSGMQHHYDALGISSGELALPRDEFAAYATGVPYVAADLLPTTPESAASWPVVPFTQKQVRGRTVRIAALTLQLPATVTDLRLLPPTEGWQRAMAEAPEDSWRILMLHGTDEQARQLVPALQPAPHLVMCADPSYHEPKNKAEYVQQVPVVYPGIRGRVLEEVTLYRLPSGTKAQIELVPLVGSLTLPGGGGDPDVKQILLAHRQQVKDAGLLQQMARRQKTSNGAAYVGSQNCTGCHPVASALFATTHHSHAFATLQKAEADPKRYGWPVTHYPDCVSCHVVGYGEESGFVDAEETPHLAGVGCERCHGPASEHVASGGQKKLGLLGGLLPALLCAQCHDFEQSPEFVYQERWAKIQHGKEPTRK